MTQSIFKHPEILLLRFTGIVLAIVSTGALVLLLISLPMNQEQRAMTVATGIALQLCLYLFARSLDKRLRRTSHLLLLISILATTAFFESSWQQYLIQHNNRQINSIANDFTVQQLRKQIENLNHEIELILRSSDNDIENNYRKRSDQRLENLKPLHEQRSKVMQKLMQQQKVISDTVTPGSWQAILTGVDREARLIIFMLLAALIDYTALLALGMVKQTDPAVPQNKTPVNQQDSEQWVKVLQQRIISGAFGYYPSQRQMMEEIKKAYENLKADGLLIKDGQRFKILGKEE